MKRKITPEAFTNTPSTGVGILSGFGTPDNPPDYGLGKGKKKVIPKDDTHPGTGLKQLNAEVNELDPDDLLGEDE